MITVTVYVCVAFVQTYAQAPVCSRTCVRVACFTYELTLLYSDHNNRVCEVTKLYWYLCNYTNIKTRRRRRLEAENGAKQVI